MKLRLAYLGWDMYAHRLRGEQESTTHMAIVAGVDFGTLSVRVSLVDQRRGRLGSGVAEYPLHRKRDDPDHATQSHEDHMRALAEAVQRALTESGNPRRSGCRAGNRYYRFECHSRWRKPGAAGRILSLVRSPRLA